VIRNIQLAAVAAVIALTSGPMPRAFAQDAADAEGDSASGYTLEEIVVTARRRQESLQDVPISVSAFSETRIQDLQADDLSGIQYSVPNLYLDKGDAGNAVIYIRGIGQNDSLAFADAGVGVYVDDVFIARSQAAFLELFDVERIEVLRGPQGTLYGRNTSGGAIKFVSTTPPDQLEVYGEIGGGSDAFATVKGRIGGPLAGDKLKGKIAFSANRRDGFAKNSVTGKDDGDLKSFAWRGALLFTPNEDVDVQFTFDGKIDRPNTSRSPVRETTVTGVADPIGAPFVPSVFQPNPDPYKVDVNANGLSDLTAYGFTLKINWRTGSAWSVESITSYRKMDFDLNLDTDGTPLPILDILVLQDEKQFSQELRLSYDAGGALAFTSGVYFFHDDDLTFSGVDFGSASLFGFPIILFGFPSTQLADTDQKTDSLAFFGDATVALTDRLSVSAGLRYTYEKKKSARRFENFFDITVSAINDTPPFLQGAGVPGIAISGKDSFDSFTPKFSASFQASDDVLLYATVAKGFKSGGFDGRANSTFGFQPFKPETVWSYEGGVKSTWADGKLIINAAYFYNDYTNLQVTSFGSNPETGTFASLFTNAAKARIQGIELEVAARPTQALMLNASVGFLDSEYKKFETLVGGVVTDVSNRKLVNAPKWNASVSATLDQPISNRLIGTAHIDANYRSKNYNEITASELLAQNKYILVNAYVSVRGEDGRWEFRAGVKNLTDRAIRVQGFNLSEFPGYQLSFFSAPRTFDFRLFYRY